MPTQPYPLSAARELGRSPYGHVQKPGSFRLRSCPTPVVPRRRRGVRVARHRLRGLRICAGWAWTFEPSSGATVF